MSTNSDRARLNEFLDATVYNQEKARAMLKEHPQLYDARVLHDETCLHHLSMEGFVKGVRFLAENGFDVNATNEFGGTPLIDTVRIADSMPECREVAIALLQLGANPNVRSDFGTPLAHAAEHGDIGLAKALLDAGADVNLADELTGPPLHIAIKKRNQDIIVLLLERGADPNYSTAFGDCASAVIPDEDPSIRQRLLEHGWRGP